MSAPTITVIIPTTGDRDSLIATLASCLDADQIIVAVNKISREQLAEVDQKIRAAGLRFGHKGYSLMWDRHASGMFGHRARNSALQDVVMSHVVSIDDDDVFLPGAFDAIRAAIAYYPGRWFVFQMVGGPGSHFPGVVCWQNRRIRIGDVGTPMIVAPASAKARWGSRGVDDFGRDLGEGYFGDYEYAAALQAELGDPVWLPVVIAEIRPAVIETADVSETPTKG